MNGAVSNGNSNNNNNSNNNSDTVLSRLHVSGKMTEADQMQRRKCENLISFFTTQIHHLNKELETEKRSRDTHLAKIAKALLCFEAKLKNDQKQIRQQLYDKDTQLNRLTSEVISLREKYGVKDGEQYKIDPVTQYCPNCRKQYYFLSSTEIGVQVNKHGLNCRDDIDKGEMCICIDCQSNYNSIMGFLKLIDTMNFVCNMATIHLNSINN